MVAYWIEPACLRKLGPFIGVYIEGHEGIALLDTGASVSSIDITLARTLKINEHGSHDLTGATGGGTYPMCDVALILPDVNFVLPAPVRGSPPNEGGLPWDAVVERDILSDFLLIVDGRTGEVTLS